MTQLIADIAIASLVMITVTVVAYIRAERKGWKK